MNPFRTIMTDTVSVVKKDGKTYTQIKASVQSKTIFITDIKIPIESGDVITRDLPSGITERFIVIDPGYHEEFHGLQAHYQIKHKREGSDTYKPPTTNYYLQGTHARVNIHSQDQSVNISYTQTNELFADMRQTVTDKVTDSDSRDALIEKINALEQSARTPDYMQTIRSSLR